MVIMAGGSGERFWPASNRSTPKQLLKLRGRTTLIEEAFNRAAGLVSLERIYVVAGEEIRKNIFRNLPRLRRSNYIAEPMARNTAACLGLTACRIEAIHGTETPIGILTADHVIEEGASFRYAIVSAMNHAAHSDDLVVIGIRPTHPETGYGYVELAQKRSLPQNSTSTEPVYRVKRFTEKPDLKTARRFVSKKNYLWNSGMFFWRAGVLLEAFDRFQPEMAERWRRLRKASSHQRGGLVKRMFKSLPSLSIDVAIMERADHVAAVTGRFKWEDVGSWDALARVKPLDADGNCRIGPSVALDSHDNIIYNGNDHDGKGSQTMIVLNGVHDLVIARTDKAILITPKSEAQKIKQVVRHLREIHREDLL